MPERDLGPLPNPPPPPADAQGNGEPVSALDAAAARRLLALATAARSAVASAVALGKEPGASPAARETAARAASCMDELTRRVPDLNRAIETLSAVSKGAPGALDLSQVAAIEVFVRCAGPLLREERRASRPVTALAGVGLPLLFSVGLSLLSP